MKVGFHHTLPEGSIEPILETNPVLVLFGFHPPLSDTPQWHIPETRCAGRAEAGSSERVSGSVGPGFKQPVPVTLPDIPSDGRPTELPAASPPASETINMCRSMPMFVGNHTRCFSDDFFNVLNKGETFKFLNDTPEEKHLQETSDKYSDKLR